MRIRKSPEEIRMQAARMAREWARESEDMGDPEGAGKLRDLAWGIERIRLTRDEK